MFREFHVKKNVDELLKQHMGDFNPEITISIGIKTNNDSKNIDTDGFTYTINSNVYDIDQLVFLLESQISILKRFKSNGLKEMPFGIKN